MQRQAWKIQTTDTVEGKSLSQFMVDNDADYQLMVNDASQLCLTTKAAVMPYDLNINGTNKTSTGFINGVPPIFP